MVHARGGNEDFVGPLAVILQLLGKDKIEIADISISLILDQYLEWLDTMTEMDLDIASEFVAMASHLAFIKTKVLLSSGEEVEELSELISSLEQFRARDIYARIKSVTDEFHARYTEGAGYIVKPPEPLTPDAHYKYEHEASELLSALLAISERGGLQEDPQTRKRPYVPTKLSYPLTEKIAELTERVRTFGVLRVQALFAECKTRSEAVATFIAVLELCRTGAVTLAGDGEDMTIRYTGGVFSPADANLADWGNENGNS
ncbi:MAG: segregation/condensation protein A [Oscillospiraceae bacterium]|nr:segregation/condensation protein A [Oscillospiraceae bacterium]